MGENEAFPTSDASLRSSQSRQKSGILTPASECSVEKEDGVGSISRKRKREEGRVEGFQSETFVVKPHPSTVFVRPRSLLPMALLPRIHLPLSCLDTASSADALPDSRLFESHVKILELEERMGTTPVLLIARLDDGKSFYAVERASRGLYVLCKIGSWVDLEELCRPGVVFKRLPHSNRDQNSGETLEPQAASSKSQVTSEAIKYSKKKRLAIEAIQSMIKRPADGTSANAQVSPNATEVVIGTAPQGITISPQVTVPEPISIQPTGPEILDNIRAQYFEALYLSKASLAYFAKGPLSRARAAFHLDYDSTLDMKDLVEFLESLVLSTTLLDKKYRDGVTSVISTLDIGGFSNDEAEQAATLKKRKARKMKPGKNALYPMEEDSIRRWWHSHDRNMEHEMPGISLEDVARKRIAQLRIRETQLQIIVILEILALRPLVASDTAEDDNLPSKSIDGLAENAKPVSKAKKSLDLAMLIDVHIDRLCIWQSVASEEGSTTTKAQSNNVSKNGSGTSAQSTAADVLRDFCVEVIIPFYSARLQEQCVNISRKLGGPVVPSPGRPKLAKSASTSNMSPRPGAMTKRPVLASKTGRSLRRVLTDERHGRSGSRGPSGAISLMRSATAPSVPILKREASETPSLGSIPAADPQSLLVSRSGVLKSKKFSQREVDLSNLNQSAGSDAKNKKASIEAELKDAISALKKPNRQLAGQAMIELAEKRTAMSASHSRKSKKPVRNPGFEGVQILATPKMHRQKDMIGNSQQLHNLGPDFGVYLENVRSSSTNEVPQSVVRSKQHIRGTAGASFLAATPSRSALNQSSTPAIDATPIRTFAAKVHGESSTIPASSPLQARQYNQQTLSVPTISFPSNDRFQTPTKNDKIDATPVKVIESANENLISTNDLSLSFESCRSIAVKTARTNSPDLGAIAEHEDVSIYKSLGWDDDGDDDLI